MATSAAGADPTSSSRPAGAVIDAVAALTGTDRLDLPPLYEAVDPEAVDALFECDHRGVAAPARVTFTYCGCDVEVRPVEGVVEVSTDGDRRRERWT